MAVELAPVGRALYVVAQPLASDLGLILALLCEPPEGRVPLQECARVHRVVSLDGRLVRYVALTLPVPQQHQLLQARPLQQVGRAPDLLALVPPERLARVQREIPPFLKVHRAAQHRGAAVGIARRACPSQPREEHGWDGHVSPRACVLRQGHSRGRAVPADEGASPPSPNRRQKAQIHRARPPRRHPLLRLKMTRTQTMAVHLAA